MKNSAYGQTVDYRVYREGTPLGVAKFEPPKFKALKEKIEGAGLGGGFEAAVVGMFDSMTCKLTFNKKTSSYLKLLAPESHHLEMRASVQGIDSGTLAFGQESERIVIRTMPGDFDLGKLEQGKAQENELEYGVTYVKVEVDGKEYLEYDRLNYIFKVDGNDYMQTIRSNMGMEG